MRIKHKKKPRQEIKREKCPIYIPAVHSIAPHDPLDHNLTTGAQDGDAAVADPALDVGGHALRAELVVALHAVEEVQDGERLQADAAVELGDLVVRERGHPALPLRRRARFVWVKLGWVDAPYLAVAFQGQLASVFAGRGTLVTAVLLLWWCLGLGPAGKLQRGIHLPDFWLLHLL